MESMIESFTLARPWWLLALVPVLIGLYFFIQRVRSAQQWNKHIAPELLSQLTDNDSSSSKPYWLSSIVFLVSLSAVIALSGPSFKSNQVQSLQTDDTLVVILDLSLSMLAEDVKPSRLQRVKFKLQDLLEKRKTGYTALIVYSGDAHVVVPLTEDTETIEHLAKSLNPWMIPSKGSRLYRAIEEANKLLEAYPSSNSRILLFTDEISNAQLNKSLEISQHPTYVVGVGSASGAPIPLPDGKLLKDGQQNIVIAKLHKEQVNALASKTGGSYNPLSINDSDIEDALTFEPSDQNDRDEMNELAAVKDFGYLLLIPLLFLMLLSFRKGWILVLPLFLIQPDHSFSAETDPATENIPADISVWDSLWKNQSQQAQQLFNQGNYSAAADLFEDPLRKGTAYAKAQDWQNAEEAFQQANTATGKYNLANVQAQQGKLDEALKSYDAAIEHATKEENQNVLERARKDKALLEQLKDQQQNQQQNQSDQQDSQGEQDSQNQQDSEGQENSNQQNNSGDQQNSQDKQESQSGNDDSGNPQDAQQNSDSSDDQNPSDQSSDQDSNSQKDQQSQQNQQSSDQQSDQNQSSSGSSEQQEESSLNEQSAQQAAQKANESREELEQQATAQNAQSSETEEQNQEPTGIHDYQTEGRPQPLSQEEIDEQKYQQTLRKIQTDPSILLENKFKIQHYQRNKPANESQVW